MTNGFIDPGNWASNLAAGSDFGYKLLWMITLSIIMLIIIQCRQWNLQDKKIIRRQLDYEFFDTFSSMIIGWAINNFMILLAVTTLFSI